MSADVVSLNADEAVVVHLKPRIAARLRSRARDVRMKPGDLAALLLDEILNPKEAERVKRAVKEEANL